MTRRDYHNVGLQGGKTRAQLARFPFPPLWKLGCFLSSSRPLEDQRWASCEHLPHKIGMTCEPLPLLSHTHYLLNSLPQHTGEASLHPRGAKGQRAGKRWQQ